MTRRAYSKPALSLDDQIAHLKLKGMTITDDNSAKSHLQHISYYRLSAYWLPFEYPKADQRPGHCFQPGTTLETVIALHDFDCKLRKLITEAVEVIEIALRGNWALEMAALGNGHSYLEPVHYRDAVKFAENVSRMQDEVRKSKERFIDHYKRTYTPAEPPVWMVSEILSFGSLSHWYANIKQRSLRNRISKPFGLNEAVFKPFIHHLTVVRNIGAHHSRLWNRQIPVRLFIPRNPPDLASSMDRGASGKLYNTLTLLSYVLREINGLADWQGRLLSHLDTLPHGDLGQLGFPTNFETLPIWNGVARA